MSGNTTILEQRIMSVIDCFNEVDAPIWYNCREDGAQLVIGGHDKAILTEGCSFSVGSGHLNNEVPISAVKLKGYTSLSVLFRKEGVKISSNLVAGRSAWYYFDDKCFILSSSQRAIVRFIGSFKFNEQAMAWMLATGNLGPGNSWDSRLKHVGANSLLLLDRQDWNLLTETNGESLNIDLPEGESKEQLNDLMEEVFNQISYHKSSDVLALSGGYDSRLVLNKMKKYHNGLDTVTWGLASARFENDSDAGVAKVVADAFKVKNIYFETDFQPRDFNLVIDRYLFSGEGRLDHINSFMDGLFMWKKLAADNYKVLYRADEVFGWLPGVTERDVRISLDFHLMEDNSNMPPLQTFDLPVQKVPEELLRRHDETISGWRDRLYRSFRLPYVLTCLHDVKSSYLEVFNPLLHDKLIRYCTALPDSSRTGKRLYMQYVDQLNPVLPLARKSSIPEPAAIFRSARFVSCMLDEFHLQSCRNLFGIEFLNWLQLKLEVDDELVNRTNDSFVLWMKSKVPWQVKKILRQDLVQYRSDFNQLAFRVYIVSRMIQILGDDAMVSKKLLNADT